MHNMTDEKKDQRIPVMMAPMEVARIDQWRASQPGLPARSEAIRRLIAQGLTSAHAIRGVLAFLKAEGFTEADHPWIENLRELSK